MSTTDLQTVAIDLAERSYQIAIRGSLFDNPLSYAELPRGAAALIVTNDVVGPLFGQRLARALSDKYAVVHTVVLPDGEENKNWQTLQLIFDALLSRQCDRKTTIYALGGGVVGDMAGFAAASYMRGIAFVQIPTTLLAQVDSSVGGKTGINHPMGKNMIGAFYQPLKVICDLDTLQSLPQREFSAGLAEVIKYGPIADMAFMDWIESNLPALLARDTQALAHAVRRSCEIKAWVVAQDEREGGLRAILNFGHTFGHAIEAGLGYGKWLHGEAVAVGMVMAAQLSARLGMVDSIFVKRLIDLLQKANLPVRGPVIDAKDNAGAYLSLMRVDKKASGGDIKFVLISELGQAKVQGAADGLVRQVIDSCCAE